jgi:hypothetical protein
MNQPVRGEKRTLTQPTGANQLHVTDIFCGKLSISLAGAPIGRPLSNKSRSDAGLFLTIHSQAAWRHGRIAEFGVGECGSAIGGFQRMNVQKTAPETKDPSGGTTGRVKPYGRLGWMGARAEYSLDGEG